MSWYICGVVFVRTHRERRHTPKRCFHLFVASYPTLQRLGCPFGFLCCSFVRLVFVCVCVCVPFVGLLVCLFACCLLCVRFLDCLCVFVCFVTHSIWTRNTRQHTQDTKAQTRTKCPKMSPNCSPLSRTTTEWYRSENVFVFVGSMCVLLMWVCGGFCVLCIVCALC